MRVEKRQFNAPRVVFCGNYDRRDDEESARLAGAWRPTARLLTRAAATDDLRESLGHFRMETSFC